MQQQCKPNASYSLIRTRHQVKRGDGPSSGRLRRGSPGCQRRAETACVSPSLRDSLNMSHVRCKECFKAAGRERLIRVTYGKTKTNWTMERRVADFGVRTVAVQFRVTRLCMDRWCHLRKRRDTARRGMHCGILFSVWTIFAE